MDAAKIVAIINSEMQLATGCTEPAAIALTAAHAGRALGRLGAQPEKIEVLASINIIKNALAAGIPGTEYTGIGYAAAIGAFAADPDRQLEVFQAAPPASFQAAERLMEQGLVSVKIADVPEVLSIDITVRGGGHSARAVIANLHTNLVRLEADEAILFQAAPAAEQAPDRTDKEDEGELSLARIFSFIDKELDPFGEQGETIRRSVAINGTISREGQRSDYGLCLGKLLESSRANGLLTDDLATACMTITAAGADARMAGAPFPVVTNSGSGNQGIAATMPVVTAAQWLKCGEEKMLRAVALSNLTTIYIKSKFGRLSALCGATVAGTGAACGITYLLGGGLQEIGFAIQNMAGNVVGMLCDGAKADCALKISTCTNAAVQAALMATQKIRVASTDGIVEEDPEKTIENFAALSRNCSRSLDSAVLEMMLAKS